MEIVKQGNQHRLRIEHYFDESLSGLKVLNAVDILSFSHSFTLRHNKHMVGGFSVIVKLCVIFRNLRFKLYKILSVVAVWTQCRCTQL